MNSSELPGTKSTGPLGQARASFDWIEFLAVPIALSVMETQPIALGLTFLALAFLQDSTAVPLDAESITLLLLGLHWWARAVSALRQDRLRTMTARLLGLFLAVAITVVTHVSLLNNIAALLFSIVLIVGFWCAGMYRVQTGPSDDYVLTSFKIGLGVLLGILMLMLLNFDPALRDELTYALPTFFLSGLIALSFTRIMMIRKENASSAQRSSQGDPTRVWLMVLTLSWIIVMISTIAFEVFGFQPLAALALFLWSGLGIVANWILQLLAPLFNAIVGLSPSIPRQRPSPLPVSHPNNELPPFLSNLLAAILFLGPLVLLGMLLCILFYIVIRTILRIWGATPDDESEEEIRESLSMQAILKARREEQRKRAQKTNALATLEPLDPTSARARYRTLLQELAWNGEKLGRRANETPSEYEKRLLTLLKKAPSEGQGDGTPPDPAMLDELTSAYIQERYGGKHPRLQRDAYVSAWIPRFVRRLAESNKQRNDTFTTT